MSRATVEARRRPDNSAYLRVAVHSVVRPGVEAQKDIDFTDVSQKNIERAAAACALHLHQSVGDVIEPFIAAKAAVEAWRSLQEKLN